MRAPKIEDPRSSSHTTSSGKRRADDEPHGDERTQDDRVISLAEACRLAGGRHRATLYRWSAQGLFPPIRRIGPSTSGVLMSEFNAWVRNRPAIEPRCKGNGRKA